MEPRKKKQSKKRNIQYNIIATAYEAKLISPKIHFKNKFQSRKTWQM